MNALLSVLLFIATSINGVLLIILIRNIQFINKSKEGTGFGSKKDIMDWRTEVISKLDWNNLQIAKLNKHIKKCS